MHRRLNSFLDRFNILYKHLYRFQRGKSTDHTLLDIHTNTIKIVQNREKSRSIFCNFAKAFNMVHHDIVYEKLKHYGILGRPLNWFNSYILGKYQWVKVNNAKSDNINCLWCSSGKCFRFPTFSHKYKRDM